MTIVDFQQVLDFWFAAENADLLFAKDDHFDAAIRAQFLDTWTAAANNELWRWRDDPHGRLAEIIILDQFSRNLWRGSAKSFSQDKMALALSQELYDQPAFNDQFNEQEKIFAVMPFMHSESKVIHKWSLAIFQEIGNENNLHYEKLHKNIIDRFGRYPHRNEVLGRETTAEEAEFLTQENSSF
ncbi:DUF924 family protein [Aerococcus sp. NPDC058936]|uniref:DUF924 family protein n=1 Tax=Aerococcus sp. NPDC058936 TaxID=3346674 RepID=UPI00366EBB11